MTSTLLYLETAWPEIEQRVRAIETARGGEPIIIVVAGGSSTGKSTHVAKGLLDRVGAEATLLQQDMQMRSAEEVPLDPRYRWDDPVIYGIPECREAIRQIRQGRPIRWPRYSFVEKRRLDSVEIPAAHWTILEGMYAADPSLTELADLSIYAEAPWIVRMVRRVLRNQYERYPGIAVASQTIASFCRTVSAAHDRFNRIQRDNVDIILRTDAPFGRLVSRFQLKPLGNGAHASRIWEAAFDPETTISLEVESSAGPLFRIWHQGHCYFSELLDAETAELICQCDPQAC